MKKALTRYARKTPGPDDPKHSAHACAAGAQIRTAEIATAADLTEIDQRINYRPQNHNE